MQGNAADMGDCVLSRRAWWPVIDAPPAEQVVVQDVHWTANQHFPRSRMIACMCCLAQQFVP